MCSQCLLSFSPKLLNLVCDAEFLPSQYTSLIEIQFGTPKLLIDGYPQLSFGSLMSAAGIFTKALNLQHYAFQDIPLNQLPSEEDDQLDASFSALPPEMQVSGSAGHSLAPTRATSLASSPKTHFSKSLSMTSVTSMAEIAPSNELLSHLDPQMCVSALELVLTFLASQSLLALKDTHLSQRDKQLIRRELSTELLMFHDFVKKRICRDGRQSCHRKKYGAFEIRNSSGENDGDDGNDDADQNVTPVPIVKSTDHVRSLRVNLAKKLHERQQHQAPFETSVSFSPIPKPKLGPAQGTDEFSAPSGSTPRRGILRHEGSTSMKRQVTFDEGSANESNTSGGKKMCQEDDDDDDPIFYEPEEPIYTGLSIVKMVEEDYLHFLSNIFTVICHTEN